MATDRKKSRRRYAAAKRRPALIGSTYARRLHVEALEERRMLAVLTVQNDLDDTLANLAGDGQLSLREAIEIANTGTTIDGFTSSDAADTIDFSVAGTINITSQLPTITEPLTIDGASQITIDAGNGADNTFNTHDGYRLFDFDDGNSGIQINVELSGLTLTGGDDAISGGAVKSRENLTITNSTISGNAAVLGGGIYNNLGTATVTSSTLSGNSATLGGGIRTYYGTTTVAYSTISGNSSSGHGGGIENTAGTITVTNSTISGNTGGLGGGIRSFIGTLTVANSLSGGDLTGSFSGSNNLIEDGSGTGLTGTISGDPLLGPLADNGGPTLPNGAVIQTHALLPGSAALDGGNSLLTSDQRGLSVPVDSQFVANAIDGNGSDLGAYEAQVTPSANFDGDLDIDGADFLAWQRGFGTTVGAARTDGNSDDDGDVDHSDLAAWVATLANV
jgi:hypothetical protein